MIIEGEEILGTNQIVPMNIHNSVKSKKIKKKEESRKNRKIQKIAIIRN
jgi:16S rRNA U1498 N3-methylase RsmE